MSISCPYKHVPYSRWRLDVLRTLFHPSAEPRRRVTHLHRERTRPLNSRRCYSVSHSVTGNENASDSDIDAPVAPTPEKQARSKEGAKQSKAFNPYSPEGRSALRNLLAELRAVGRHADRQSPAHHRSMDLSKLREKRPPKRSAIGDRAAGDRQVAEDLLKELWEIDESHETISVRTLKPSILERCEVALDAIEAKRPAEKSSDERIATTTSTRDTSSARKSAIFRWLADAEKRRKEEKIHPSYHEIEGLKNNPWAEILAGPIRACQGSGARLPGGLLLDLGYVKNPKDGKVYLMPAKLADLDALKAYIARNLQKPWTIGAAAQQELSEQQDDSDPVDQGSVQTNTPKKHRSSVQTQSRLLSNITLLNYITTAVTQPGKKQPRSSAPTAREGVPGEISKLVHFEAREAVLTAQHYEQNKRRFDVAIGGRSRFEIASADKREGGLNLHKLQWQIDVPSRIVHIMQNRVLVAMRGLAISDAKAQNGPSYPSAIMPLAIPQDGKFNGDELRTLQSAIRAGDSSPSSKPDTSTFDATLRAVLGEYRIRDDEGPSENFSPVLRIDPSASAGSSSAEPFPQQSLYYNRLGHPEWLPGSIFLYTGSDELSFPPSPSLPPLPGDNPLIPPMVTVSNKYRFPIFSLHRLFRNKTNSTISTGHLHNELQNLFDQLANFRTPAGNVTDAKHENHMLLIRPLQGPAKALIEETWRLWRYLGGESMDVAFSEDGTGLEVEKVGKSLSEYYKDAGYGDDAVMAPKQSRPAGGSRTDPNLRFTIRRLG